MSAVKMQLFYSSIIMLRFFGPLLSFDTEAQKVFLIISKSYFQTGTVKVSLIAPSLKYIQLILGTSQARYPSSLSQEDLLPRILTKPLANE